LSCLISLDYTQVCIGFKIIGLEFKGPLEANFRFINTATIFEDQP